MGYERVNGICMSTANHKLQVKVQHAYSKQTKFVEFMYTQLPRHRLLKSWKSVPIEDFIAELQHKRIRRPIPTLRFTLDKWSWSWGHLPFRLAWLLVVIWLFVWCIVTLCYKMSWGKSYREKIVPFANQIRCGVYRAKHIGGETFCYCLFCLWRVKTWLYSLEWEKTSWLACNGLTGTWWLCSCSMQ